MMVTLPLRIEKEDVKHLKVLVKLYRQRTIERYGIKGKMAKAFPAVSTAKIARWVVGLGLQEADRLLSLQAIPSGSARRVPSPSAIGHSSSSTSER